MSRLPRRPTHTQSRRMASSLSLLLAFTALICLCPVSVKADEANVNKRHGWYGTVIGIGESPNCLLAEKEPDI